MLQTSSITVKLENNLLSVIEFDLFFSVNFANNYMSLNYEKKLNTFWGLFLFLIFKNCRFQNAIAIFMRQYAHDLH